MAKSKKDLGPKTPKQVILAKRRNLINKLSFTDLIKKIIMLILVAYLIFTFIFGVKVLKNNDMSPRMSASDLLIYYRLDKEYVANDVLVVNKDGNEYVSRVVAMAGDTVDITENGLVINGSVQANSNIYFDTGIYEDGIKFPITLNQDEVFVLGDLREGAMDSRYFGPVKYGQIKGKIFVLLRRTAF